MSAFWTVHRGTSSRFPYRVAIESDGRVILAVRAPSPWPGPGQQIFCLREDPNEGEEQLDPVERVPVLQMKRIGRKLAIVLDRALRKRCEFLSISKPYRDRPGTYEQIFFRTESGIRAHRSRTRLELQSRETAMDVVVDSGERYAWRFPGARLTKRKLPGWVRRESDRRSDGATSDAACDFCWEPEAGESVGVSFLHGVRNSSTDATVGIGA